MRGGACRSSSRSRKTSTPTSRAASFLLRYEPVAGIRPIPTAFGIIPDVATSGAGNPGEAFEGHLEFETLLSDLSSRFVNLPPADLDHEIEGALRRVSECLGIDMAVLWQWPDSGGGDVTATHIWPHRREPAAFAEPLRQDLFPWVAGELRAGRMSLLVVSRAASGRRPSTARAPAWLASSPR